MYTLLKSIQVRETLVKRSFRIFTRRDFERIFDLAPHSAKYYLETYTQDGLLYRLKRGIYALNTDQPIEEEIANTLYKPSYISFEYALAYHGLLLEMPYVVTSATTKATRLIVASEKTYSYRTIKREAFTGYSMVKQNGGSFMIAEKEKAVVDYLYFVSLHKASHNDRLLENIRTKVYSNNSELNVERILSYTKLFANSRLSILVNSFI